MNALPYTENDCWQAVLQRDSSRDGQFVTAVQSTGIYCRPSCPARHPKRQNVRFFATNAEAEAAGFRPCRRCRPDEVDAHTQLVQQACAYIDAHLEAAPPLAELGAALHVSPFHLQRIFKRVMGVSPRQYAEAQRLARFKAHLKEGDSVTRALYDAGYGSSSRLYPGLLGMKPSAYRQGGKDMCIHYAIAPCDLGYVLVAATERGLCAVSLGDTPEFLRDALHAEYPAAEIVAQNSGLEQQVAALLDYLQGHALRADLPLDVQATAFQQRVWQTLRAIPYGQTRTYTQIAHAIGQPQAARAVANACAANHVALVIPCHRVVREDGGMGGYKWGVARKETLLAREARAGQ
ncbi:MAG: bifunctional DNA-binding transcriptional regulator/O6-methylguanine-DNA methyltransferase Ada [Chloroflexi bacterium]|nr:bifunctional DNA-binding transcriptional regulator/O6-methylguanine-DNA methyltransferase Ada [Chloroflexota bacterium]